MSREDHPSYGSRELFDFVSDRSLAEVVGEVQLQAWAGAPWPVRVVRFPYTFCWSLDAGWPIRPWRLVAGLVPGVRYPRW